MIYLMVYMAYLAWKRYSLKSIQEQKNIKLSSQESDNDSEKSEN